MIWSDLTWPIRSRILMYRLLKRPNGWFRAFLKALVGGKVLAYPVGPWWRLR